MMPSLPHANVLSRANSLPRGGFRLLRRVCALVLLVVLTPSASAVTAVVELGPDEPDHHYLRLTATDPEAPRSAKGEDDCGADARPQTTEEGIAQALRPYQESPLIFTESGTTDPYVPGCLAFPVNACSGSIACAAAPASAYASYDVRTGRYYLEYPIADAMPFRSHSTTHVTGTTGFAAEGDCNGCPPPVLLS